MNPATARSAYYAWQQGTLAPQAQAELAVAIVHQPEIDAVIREELRFDTELALAVRGIVAAGLTHRVAGVQRTQGSQRRRDLAHLVWRRAASPRSWWLRSPVVVATAALLMVAVGLLAWLVPARVGMLELPASGWERDGDIIRITKPEVMLHGPAGLEVELRLGTTIASDPGRNALELRHGFARVAAPHRPPGDPLRFMTPHMSALVVGTHFTLGNGSGTTLRVSEGTVLAQLLPPRGSLRPDLGTQVTAGESFRHGVVGEWDLTWDTQEITTEGGTRLVPATDHVRGHALSAARGDHLMTINFTIPTNMVIPWGSVTAVELDLEASEDPLQVLLIGTDHGSQTSYAVSHQTTGSGTWQLLRLPANALLGEMPPQCNIRKLVISASSARPIRLGRLAFVAPPLNNPP